VKAKIAAAARAYRHFMAALLLCRLYASGTDQDQRCMKKAAPV
jgi:hypothetical protein